MNFGKQKTFSIWSMLGAFRGESRKTLQLTTFNTWKEIQLEKYYWTEWFMAYQLDTASRFGLKCYKLRSAVLKLRTLFGNFIVHIPRQNLRKSFYPYFMQIHPTPSVDIATVPSEVTFAYPGNGLQSQCFPFSMKCSLTVCLCFIENIFIKLALFW